MKKIAVVYWSGTGNTEAMAQAVARGVREAGGEVSLFAASDFTSTMVPEYAALAFGCPSMGAEELEDSEFAPMFESCEKVLPGKEIALFGSYGWGDGQWMRDWEDHCRSIGLNIVCDSVICMEAPDEDATQSCIRLGKVLSE